MKAIQSMNRLGVCALLLLGSVATAQTPLEKREAIRKAREAQAAAQAQAARAATQPDFSVLDQRIEAAQRSPNDARLALEATQTLRDFLRGSTDAAAREQAMGRLPSVESLITHAISANPNDASLLLMEKASLLFNAGRKGEVEALIQASMDARPSLDAALALIGIHSRRGEKDQIFPLCQRTRPQVVREVQVWELLDACIKGSGALTPESGLSWASTDDKVFYFREAQRRNAAVTP
jgi:hypothetical protein